MSGAGVRASIVVPTRGDSWPLRAMLASLDVALPLDADVEVILVHDGDGSALSDDLVAGFGHPITRTATGRRAGPATARNHGAERATGTIIVFLDDDIIVPYGWYEGLDRALAEHPDAGLIGGPLRSVAERNLISQTFEALVIRHEHRDGRWYLASACLAIRRDALRQLGGFDERLHVSGEDWDLSRRAHTAGITVAHSEHLIIHHRNPTRPTQILSRARSYGSSFGRSGVVPPLEGDGPLRIAGVTLPARLGPLRPFVRAVTSLMATIPSELLHRSRALAARRDARGRTALLMAIHIPWFLVFATASWLSQLEVDRAALRALSPGDANRSGKRHGPRGRRSRG